MECSYCGKEQPTIKKMEVYEASKVLVLGLKRFHNGMKNDRAITVEENLIPRNF